MNNNSLDNAVHLSFDFRDFISYKENDHFYLEEPELYECCWHCPKELGNGTFKKISLKEGFDLWMTNCAFHQDLIFKDCAMPKAIQFTFVLSCHYHVQFEGWQQFKQYRGEHQAIGYYNNICSYYRILHKLPVRYVTLTLTPEAFARTYEEYLHQMPSFMLNMLNDNSSSGYQFQSSISPDIRQILQQINNCPYTGLTRKLYLESKALELLSLQLHQLCHCPSDCQSCIRMHPHDRKQIEGIRDLLLCRLDTPPSLKELAKTAGMSHPKLNRCFKQVYGMTVFQYLRLERLNKAKSMLQKDGYSVTETALEVGYDSVSHFSQAYKRQFGTSPSTSLKIA